MTEGKKLWGGRFTGQIDPGFARFNRSFGFDRRLFEADVMGSLAHCDGLFAAGVISDAENVAIADGLLWLLARWHEAGDSFLADESAEDVHSFIESRLIDRVGDVGRRLHTGRSRNDQVATALRLWLRDETARADAALRGVQTALLDLADSHADAVLPGYTHLQRAQPVLFAHWCLAYFEMFARDRERLSEARRRMNVMPLGSAALAGTSHPIDRERVARFLGFDSVSRNSLDAVSDRDFCVEFASASALVMAHLSRLAEDLIVYATTEFGFVELSDAVATGSSLMPQKKNPDALELVRGKSARVFGHALALLALIKGLPLTYNKDMQEDKEAVFDTADTVRESLDVTATVLRNVRLREARARDAASVGYMNATEMADYLVRRGVPFREAHEAAGRMVLHGLSKGLELHELELEELQEFSPLVSEDVYEALSLEQTLATKSQAGGTSPGRVREALAAARASL
ncbi:MAG: argininosuccinate lyase [Acidobacteria bacterium]|nr:argininosuccinate lyase [Acidobacteriota bacterium]